MNFNSFLFPKPYPPTYIYNFQKEKLIYVISLDKSRRIPCFLLNEMKYNEYLIFFHGNGEDLYFLIIHHFIEGNVICF